MLAADKALVKLTAALAEGIPVNQHILKAGMQARSLVIDVIGGQVGQVVVGARYRDELVADPFTEVGRLAVNGGVDLRLEAVEFKPFVQPLYLGWASEDVQRVEGLWLWTYPALVGLFCNQASGAVDIHRFLPEAANDHLLDRVLSRVLRLIQNRPTYLHPD